MTVSTPHWKLAGPVHMAVQSDMTVIVLIFALTYKQVSIRYKITTQILLDWLSSVLRPHQHSISYTVDGFYRSKDTTNSIKVLKAHIDYTI